MFTNGRPPFVIVLEGRERRQMDLSRPMDAPPPPLSMGTRRSFACLYKWTTPTAKNPREMDKVEEGRRHLCRIGANKRRTLGHFGIVPPPLPRKRATGKMWNKYILRYLTLGNHHLLASSPSAGNTKILAVSFHKPNSYWCVFFFSLSLKLSNGLSSKKDPARSNRVMQQPGRHPAATETTTAQSRRLTSLWCRKNPVDFLFVSVQSNTEKAQCRCRQPRTAHKQTRPGDLETRAFIRCCLKAAPSGGNLLLSFLFVFRVDTIPEKNKQKLNLKKYK